MGLLYFSRNEIDFVKSEFYKKLESYNRIEYKLNEFENVVVLNDSFILFVAITERIAFEIHNVGRKYYSFYVEELFPNEIGFKYNNTKFCSAIAVHFNLSYINNSLESAEGSSIIYKHFRGFSPIYWSNFLSLPQKIANLMPELKLNERYELWEGFHYYFIVIEFIVGEKVKRGVAYTMTRPHTYIITLGKKYIKTGKLSNEIRAEQSFFTVLNELKGIPRKVRLENYMEYFFLENNFREKDDVWRYADELLEQANENKFKDVPRSIFIKPVYKWTSEELCLKLTKKLYKQYNVIYQYKPFFLRSSFGGQMSYDIFIQVLNVAIEYQGKQHFYPVDFFGGEKSFEKQRQRDIEKKELSMEYGIKLVYINFDEPITAELIKQRVSEALG